ncbi:MAG: ACP S-malonyltransferase [Myxococcota bacterium]|nr:ACP S-malonyltransferase [Myxococcota bacterium]
MSEVLALLFPGQGSQQVGMGKDLAETSSAARDVFAAADRALGFEVSRYCFEGPEEDLRRTEIQQPALLTTSIALLRALAEGGPVEPAFVAGHSLGEYSALVASGAMDFEDAVRVVNARGRYMQEAVAEGKGAMAAILGCSAEEVAAICARVAAGTGQVVSPANYNSPQQTVIAGDSAAVAAACEGARENGAKKVVDLPVSAPFHCALMAPAAEKLKGEMETVSFRSPSPPVVTNVEATPNADATRIPELLIAQVTAPVRFTEMIQRLEADGVTHFLEVGAGRVLTGLLARIDRRSKRESLGAVSDLENARNFIAEARGVLS